MAERFSCSLDVLHGGLGISKFQFLICKKSHFFAVNFFQILVMICSRIRIGIQPKMLAPESINPDTKHWFDLSFHYHLSSVAYSYLALLQNPDPMKKDWKQLEKK
jgi:hypothetical protein